MWQTIIADILKVLGPILSDALNRWLDGKLKAAAKADPVADGIGESDRAKWLFASALDATPRRQPFRRAFLRQALESVPRSLAAGKLNIADRKELTALAGAAGDE